MKYIALLLVSCAKVIVPCYTQVTWQNIIDGLVTFCQINTHIENPQQVVRDIYLCKINLSKEPHIRFSPTKLPLVRKMTSLIGFVQYKAPRKNSLNAHLSVSYPQGLGFNITFVKFETGFSGRGCPYAKLSIIRCQQKVEKASIQDLQVYHRICGKPLPFTYIHKLRHSCTAVESKGNFPVNINMIIQPMNFNDILKLDKT